MATTRASLSTGPRRRRAISELARSWSYSPEDQEHAPQHAQTHDECPLGQFRVRLYSDEIHSRGCIRRQSGARAYLSLRNVHRVERARWRAASNGEHREPDRDDEQGNAGSDLHPTRAAHVASMPLQRGSMAAGACEGRVPDGRAYRSHGWVP